jgi:hypothetical protein
MAELFYNADVKPDSSWMDLLPCMAFWQGVQLTETTKILGIEKRTKQNTERIKV